MVVTEGSCAKVSWVPIEQHTEDTTVCPTASGAYDMPHVGDRRVDRRDPPRPRPFRARPPPTCCRRTRRPGQRWSATCTLGQPGREGRPGGQVFGPATLDVRGQPVAVEHVRLTLTFNGAQQGTNPTDYWIVAEHRPHRAREGAGGGDFGRRALQRIDGDRAHLAPARRLSAQLPASTCAARRFGAVRQ